MKSRTWALAALMPLVLGGLATGCDDGDDPPAKPDTGAPDGATPSPDMAGPGPDGGAPDMPMAETGDAPAGETGNCPAEIPVSEDIVADTTWSCPVYSLKKLVYVNAKLTISEGVTIVGDATAPSVTALVVTREGQLFSMGSKTKPVVFTASVKKAQQWGGVVLLGKAKLNGGTPCTGEGCKETNIEGIDPTEPKGKFGGTDDEHNCGTITYTRIEFAGKILTASNELNGLTVGGCGRQTKLSYIQVHSGSDDGVEFFGGTAGIDHLLVSNPDDDGLDWDLGWTGHGQFIVVHQMAGGADNFGIEASNAPSDATPPKGMETDMPRSAPTLFNVTLIGRPDDCPAGCAAMRLKEGTRGKMSNFIIHGWKKDVIDFTHKVVDLTMEWPTYLSIENSVFSDNIEPWPAEVAGMPSDDDKGFPDQMSVEAAERKNTKVSVMFTALNDTAPNYVPTNADAVMGKATPTFGDTTATYAGAFAPGQPAWTDGWTAFPASVP